MGVWYNVLITVWWDLEMSKDHETVSAYELSRALFVRLRELGVWIPRLALCRALGQCPFVSSGSPREDSDTEPLILDLLGDTEHGQTTVSGHTCAVLTVPELRSVVGLFESNRPFYYALFDLCGESETWTLAKSCSRFRGVAMPGGVAPLTPSRVALLDELEGRLYGGGGKELLLLNEGPRDWEDPDVDRERPTKRGPHKRSAPCQSPQEAPVRPITDGSYGWGSLPEHVLLSVFENLDGVSTWRASRVCQRWACVANGEELQKARGVPDPIMIALADVG